VLLAGCNESLFGAHHGGHVADAGDDAPDSNTVPGVCTAPCVADAGAEFDGTAGGLRGHWRYLDDARSPQRTWNVMTVGAGEMIGAGSNRITSCAMHPEAAACTALPGALLVSSTDATSLSDPAIEFKAPTGQVLQLSLHAFVPAGADQTIRLYRNSREDVLFTGTASAGTTVAHEITVDALPGDRFLVAVAPTGNGAADVGLQLFITAADKAFPSTCQLALQFEVFTGNSFSDLQCRNGVFTHFDSAGKLASLAQVIGPFKELGSADKNQDSTYLRDLVPSDALDYSQDVTVQLWAQLRTLGANPAWLFSDLDSAGRGGGFGISIAPGSPMMVDVQTRTDPASSAVIHATAPASPLQTWLFIRVVRTGTQLQVCLDGAPAANVDVGATRLSTTRPPDLGKEVQAPSAQASFDGYIDDVRVITGALPCN
jgi:hypothetical protein